MQIIDYPKDSYGEIIAERLNMNNLRCSEGIPLGESEGYSEWVGLTAKRLNVKYANDWLFYIQLLRSYAHFLQHTPLIASGVIHIQSLRDFTHYSHYLFIRFNHLNSAIRLIFQFSDFYISQMCFAWKLRIMIK